MPGKSDLRKLFARDDIIRTIGVHNALGARLGERAGFDAVWASGLEMSASHGVPDADILTMSDLLAAIHWITSAVRVPVIADCDAGYGNASNVAHMVRRYEAAGVAAVCIEDKVFPKTNSFVSGRQRLVSIPEFVGKLAAAKAAQTDPDFIVIARVEALIAGHGLDEALKRATAYAEAGADAILIHAKGASPQPVLDFLSAWNGAAPVVVVPTTYHVITGKELQQAGAKMVIYANHGIRAGTQAMIDVFGEILRTDGTTSSEDHIAPLDAILELQGTYDLLAHDARYVRGADQPVHDTASDNGRPVAQ
jgi:phosphoenolpyruvate phosphomutase